MTDEPLSDCSNSACAEKKKKGSVMIIFHSPLQIFWPSFAFCGIRKEKKPQKGLRYLLLAVWPYSWYVSVRVISEAFKVFVGNKKKITAETKRTGGVYVRFQLHVWASHYRKLSPGPVWSTLQPFSPWKKTQMHRSLRTISCIHFFTQTSNKNSSLDFSEVEYKYQNLSRVAFL